MKYEHMYANVCHVPEGESIRCSGASAYSLRDRDVTDEESLDYARNLNDPADPDRHFLFRTVRTNQLLS